jgi:hypothetical protein
MQKLHRSPMFQSKLKEFSQVSHKVILLLCLQSPFTPSQYSQFSNDMLHSRSCTLSCTAVINVKVKVTLRLTVSQSVSLGVEPHKCLLLFDNYSLVFVGRPLWREDESVFLHRLLVLASAVFLGSESLGTRHHILLTQIWDIPYRRLLQLAGSRWRYSTPPPSNLSYNIFSLYGFSTDYIENTRHVTANQPAYWRADCCLATTYNIRPIVSCAYRGVFIEPLRSNALSTSVKL